MIRRFFVIAFFFTATPAVAQTVIDMNQPAANENATVLDGETAEGLGGEESEGAVIRPTVHRITSLEKCLNQLPPEEAAEVRLNPVRPYQECIARLSNVSADRKKKKRQDAEEMPVAENARNYSRIQESPVEGENGGEPGFWAKGQKPPRPSPAAYSEEDEAPEGLAYDGEEEEQAPRKTFGGKGWLPEIKPDNSRAKYNN